MKNFAIICTLTIIALGINHGCQKHEPKDQTVNASVEKYYDTFLQDSCFRISYDQSMVPKQYQKYGSVLKHCVPESGAWLDNLYSDVSLKDATEFAKNLTVEKLIKYYQEQEAIEKEGPMSQDPEAGDTPN